MNVFISLAGRPIVLLFPSRAASRAQFRTGKDSTVKKRLVRISVAVLIGAGLFAGLVVGLIHTLGDRESLYENQPAYFWLCRLTNQDAAVRHQAMSILNRQIIPHLTWVMFQDTNDIALKIELIEKLNKLPNVNIFYTTASVRSVKDVHIG